MFVVIAYDIVDDRRRVKLHTLLLGYGTPVQRSVFECILTDRQLRDVKRRISKVIRRGHDDVRLYPLCAACRANAADATGTPLGEEVSAVVV